MTGWQYFILGVVFFFILRAVVEMTMREIKEYRDRRFVKFVQVTFKDHESIHFIAVDSSDRRSLKKVVDEIETRFGVPKEDIPYEIRAGGGFRN